MDNSQHRLGILRQRDFRLLWSGETVSEVGNAMATVAMPLLAVATLHASTLMVGLLSSMAYLPWLLIGLPAGAWVDRLPSRPVMIAADVAAAVLYASVPLADRLHVLTIGQILLVALLGGAANVMFSTAYSVNLRGLLAAEDLMEGNAKLQGSQYAARIFGPGLGGLVAQLAGATVTLLLNGTSFLVSAVCLSSIRTTGARTEPPPARRPVRQEIAEGFRWVLRDPYMRPMSVYAAFTNLAMTGYMAMTVVFLVRVVGLGAGTVGVLMTTSGVGGLLGSLAVRRLTRRLGTARSLLLSTLGTMPLCLLIPLTGPGPRTAFFVVGTLGVVGGVGVTNIIMASFRQMYCPPGMLGRVTATVRFVTMGATPVGALLGGVLGTAFGVRGALWILLAFAVLPGTALLTPAIRGRRDLPTAPPAPADANPPDVVGRPHPAGAAE